jgi:tetratricopeptide (TPR) repeat protein
MRTTKGTAVPSVVTRCCTVITRLGSLRMMCGCVLCGCMTCGDAISAQTPAASLEVPAASTSPRSEGPVHTDVRPSRFQDITPGKTTRAGLIESTGEPVSEVTQGEEVVLTYQLGPFPKVEIILAEDVVESIIVHLETASSSESVAKELGLTSFVPAMIYGEEGERLGQVYPERGVAFSFAPDTDPPAVGQIVLEPISPEFFLLRVKSDRGSHYERTIADLNYVLKADSGNALARSLKANVYAAAGYDDRALSNIEAALAAEPQNSRYRLLRAELQLRLGQHAAAMKETKSVLDQANSSLIRGRAEALLGDLMAKGPTHDYQGAMKHHLIAVETLTPLVVSPQVLLRHEAREVMLKLHLAIANDITHGKWSGKNESAPAWLKIARELTEQMIAEDDGDEALQLYLYRQALASYVGMRGLVDPSEVANAAVQLGKKLLSKSKDELRHRELRWLVVDALVEAVRAEQLRGETDQVTRYTREADDLMNALEDTEETKVRLNYTRGRLYFLVGSTFAIQKGDHKQAVDWFEKALPYLMTARPLAGSIERVRHGQRFISMGVSYWETNGRDEAIRLTESGLQIMSTAVETGELDPSPLAVPYGNLAAMYKSIGRDEDARRLATKASQLEVTR